uniref:Coenzyme F420-reducing hydrogenase, beta subunit n=1 Tax=Candidatus Kentrum sp. TC TaxID=2126339 RepID=A0A450YPX3_9GAMM|nr:MAG: Coenzyme F420-reducing hydrogenase, beta subunit [Candidatus Kentron sp. TC]
MKNIPHHSVAVITDNDLCVSCGACFHICPYENIQIRLDSRRGKWEPVMPETDICDRRCNGKELCLSVCPSYDVDYIALAESDKNNLLGRIERVYTGFSRNEEIRFGSSSGGFIRELCAMLLDSGEIDGVISITHDEGLEYTPKIVRDIGQMPCSVYYNIDFENAIDLLRNSDGKYLLIALPCQITSIELFTNKKKYRHLKERIYAKVALICGYVHDRTSVEAIFHYHHFDSKEITYRGNGRDPLINMRNGSEELEYDAFYPKNLKEVISSRMMFDNFLPQLGCLFCVDHIGYCADLVVGDAWLEKYRDDKVGVNIIISRTRKAEELIRRMTSFDFTQAPQEDIVKAQGAHYALGAVGEGLKEIKIKGNDFVPNKRRTRDPSRPIQYDLRTKDVIKIKIIKPLMRKRRFMLAKLLCMVLEIKCIFRYAFKRYPADGFFPPFGLLPFATGDEDDPR